ncbi:MAG: hypothetical protein ACFFCQ_02800 [Promethearchaeota archaeon]
MNSDDKLKELGKQVELSDEEITAIKNSKWYRVNPVVYIIFGIIAILASFQGYVIGKDEGSYPFRIFLGPLTITTTERNTNILRIIGIGVLAILLAFLCFIISYFIGFESAPISETTTNVVNGTTYSTGVGYGVWSI